MAPAVLSSISLVARDSLIQTILSRGESVGLAFDTEAALCSAIAASAILILILVSSELFQVIYD